MVTQALPRREPMDPRLVLIADRDDDTRQMYKEFLCHAFDAHEASDGREALAKAVSLEPDLLVTETRLPGIDGYELIELLRHDPVARSKPIVVVTGDGYRSDVDRAIRAGATSVLVKPCLPEILLLEIRRLIRRSRKLREYSQGLRAKLSSQLARSQDLYERVRATQRKALSHSFNRHETTSPALPPPALLCPACDRQLVYQHSNVGGVSERHPEQWDYFECPSGCGTFQFRQRTRSVRKVS